MTRSNLPALTLFAIFLLMSIAPTAAQTPAATVEDGSDTVVLQSNVDGGLLAPGTFGVGTIPTSGAGTRLMWYPAKAALRAGAVGMISPGDEWDDTNIGLYSMAFGRGTKASGEGTTAMGNFTTASGKSSTAMGHRTTANSAFSTAMGYQTIASGDYSTAMGEGTTASGGWSTAMGSGTTAEGSESTAMGKNATATGSASTAMGTGTTASGGWSTAMGLSTTAASAFSLSIGKFNTANSTDDNTLFVAGNGTSAINFDALVLDRSGNLTIAGTLTQSSDARLKEAIRPLQKNVLGRLGQIRPVHFRFKDERMHPSGEQIGLLAQEVQQQFPALVSKGSGGYLSVSYSKLTAVLLKGLQEQKAQIEALQARAERVDALEARLATIEAVRTGRPAGWGWPAGALVLGLIVVGGAMWHRRR